MKGCIIYFSATGNTEFIAHAIKSEFLHLNIYCDLVEISKNPKINDQYDFFVFGSPIHAELFPDFYTKWVENNIESQPGKKCIVYSTQASRSSCGPELFSRILKKKGFDVIIEECIFMPNNYYTVMLKKFTDDEASELLKKAEERSKEIVNKFMKNEKMFNTAKERVIYARPVFKLFMLWSKKWAKNNLTVKSDICISCKLCQEHCPVKNINVGDDNIVTFYDKCISCQRCIHKCPVNAFLYKKRPIQQYKIRPFKKD